MGQPPGKVENKLAIIFYDLLNGRLGWKLMWSYSDTDEGGGESKEEINSLALIDKLLRNLSWWLSVSQSGSQPI